ncbi:MAG: hypothetical protein NC211_08900 [Alistipes senegalensis]|nr:hypothetical protein [Oxalobacter formigenes]MCM1281925.1 hypothetical protein [Alistipes senegalensis]
MARELKLVLYEIATEDNKGCILDGNKRLRAFTAAHAFFSQDKAMLLFDEAEDVFSMDRLFHEVRHSATRHG